ncbi:MAG: L,D-transpeptidase family protein [Verrucomicrobia bacterium]|nr:L,D-transpeptidase family protein [Verrucomicrobiota bacterium]
MKISFLIKLAALRFVSAVGMGTIVLGLCQCKSTQTAGAQVVVSVKEQKLAVYDSSGKQEQKYPVSTSKFGINDKPGTYGTPIGMHEVVAKIGQGARVGAVFKNRRQTGEVIKPGTPGRDPIVSRIMWLRGMESQNKNAYGRCIYIHGTADEADIGRAVSYGCIRMKSRDVVDLFNMLPIGARVYITPASLPAVVSPSPAPSARPATRQAPLLLNPDGGQSSSAPVRLADSGSAKTRTEQPDNISSQHRQLPDGSTVIYSAPRTGGPGVVLRSKRKATQTPHN